MAQIKPEYILSGASLNRDPYSSTSLSFTPCWRMCLDFDIHLHGIDIDQQRSQVAILEQSILPRLPDTALGFVKMFSDGNTPFEDTPNLVAPRGVFEILSAHCLVLLVIARDDDIAPGQIGREVAESATASESTWIMLLNCPTSSSL